MTARGDATRARLLAATRSVVRAVGYAHASTRAIAAEAGVAEGTIYRHFPDKASLFIAAVLDANQAVVGELAALPDRAGSGSLEANLVEALEGMASLRDDIMPLELAIAADPELAARQRTIVTGAAGTPIPGPPQALAAYLAGEQRAGRVRSDLDPRAAAVVLLVAMSGLILAPSADVAPGHDPRIQALVRIVVHGIGEPTQVDAG